MDLLQMPVTLVVKAPNQKMADHTVECDLGWTIQKLKKHLEDVYPSKPKEHQQRIIYSGKLLQDDLVLKDILRQHTEDQTVHTVHLVCSNPPASSSSTSISSQNSSSHSSYSSSSETNSSSSNSTVPDTEGVRHRHVTSTESEHVNTAIPQFNQQQFTGGNVGLDGAYTMGGMIPGMAPYTPEQMMWFQQMYAQQWAQYMQSYYGIQQPEFPSSANHEAEAPEPMVQQEPRAANQRPANGNQAVRMNAQGGGVFEDDDDEENLNRDWLDWVYALCRFLVLVSILYFYSTFGRFVVVFGFFILAYMYQAGWFRINRRNDVQERRRQERQAEPEPVEPQNDQQQQNVENETEEAPRQPEAPAPPGALTIAWSFITTFFSSLVPQAPPAVNGN